MKKVSHDPELVLALPRKGHGSIAAVVLPRAAGHIR